MNERGLFPGAEVWDGDKARLVTASAIFERPLKLRTGSHSDSPSHLEAHEVLQRKMGRSELASMLMPLATSTIQYTDIAVKKAFIFPFFCRLL